MSLSNTTLSAVGDYCNAVAALGQISSIRPVPCLADALAALTDALTTTPDASLRRVRAEILRDAHDPIALHNLVRLAEVLGVASAVATCFKDTPHQAVAQRAVYEAGRLTGFAMDSFKRRSEAPATGKGDGGYRAGLFEQLDWVHQYGSRDCITRGDDYTCLSLFTTYLQLVLRTTPMDKWATALATDTGSSNPSPLQLAWKWARDSSKISPATADVVLLVTMGRDIERVVADAQRTAQKAARASNRNQGLWGTLSALWERLRGTACHTRSTHLRTDDYKLIADTDMAQAMQLDAQMLLETGKDYAELLSKGEVVMADVQDILDRLRTWTASIVAKAEPLAPHELLHVIPGLDKRCI